jgi:2-methylisocitrate lyase-like PEP mutase family enzyme
MTTQAEKAEFLRALHVPGDPLILTNVWDAVTARIVAGVPGVRAVASASHSVSYVHGIPDGEGLTLDQALTAASEIDGRVSVIAGTTSLPLRRLAQLGVSRVSFGPGILRLTLSHLREAVGVLTSRGEYPPELDFEY